MQLIINEVNSQINNLTVLRSFPGLSLSNSLILQRNLDKLKSIEKDYLDSESILKDKLKNNEEEKSVNYDVDKLLIIKDFEDLWKTKYELEFKTILLSLFPDDINTRPSKKVTNGQGKEIEVSYVDVLLDSIGYSVQDDK